MLFCRFGIAVTGDGAMGDRIERAVFNAAPATVARDFKTHVYFQSPNRVVCDSPIFDHGPRQTGEIAERAMNAVHNDRRADVLGKELRRLAQVGNRRNITSQQILKDLAK